MSLMGRSNCRRADYRGLVAVLHGEGPRWYAIPSLEVRGSVEDYGSEFEMTAAPLHFFIKTKKR